MATPVTAERLRLFSKQQQLQLDTSTASQVRVVVRIRPFLPSEVESFCAENQVPCVSVVSAQDDLYSEEVTVQIKDQFSSRSECYKLDSVFGLDDDLGAIFRQEVAAVIPGLFMGFNSTIFAYGATGSGKTYTMQGTDGNPGIISQALSSIFSKCQKSGRSVEISYFEIYLDRCYDLLEPKAREITVLEDASGKIQLKGLCKVPIHSMEEFNEAFSSAIQRRKVAYTGLNDVSSRSHGILSVLVSDGYVKGKLNLIDLAGNEDNRRTCNQGLRLQESAKINQSLFALSNVIYALNNNMSRVPYRESKLTRILQDSLGGTSRALMIACLNPGSYQEAVHTVSLAARSRHIVNYVDSGHKLETPKVKVDMEAKLRVWLESKGKVKSLQRINGSRSPFLGKTPPSLASTSAKPKVGTSSTFMPRSNAKSRSNAKDVSKESVPRKLFDCSAPALGSTNENILPSESTMTVGSSAWGDAIFLWKETLPHDGKLDGSQEKCADGRKDDHLKLDFSGQDKEDKETNGMEVALLKPEVDTSSTLQTRSTGKDVSEERCCSSAWGDAISSWMENLPHDGKLDRSQEKWADERKDDDNRIENMLRDENIVTVGSSTCSDWIIQATSSWKETPPRTCEENSLNYRLRLKQTEAGSPPPESKLDGSKDGCSHGKKGDRIKMGFFGADKDNTVANANKPPQPDDIQELQRSLRKVLSPVNSNSMTPSVSNNKGHCIFVLDPKTPKSPPNAYEKEKLQTEDTPLNKFSSQSVNLKETLAKEYIEFLNVASKAELLALKGIGEKRAECILKLREQSPLKSIPDLEKIGLSSKQANDLFRKTARGIFA